MALSALTKKPIGTWDRGNPSNPKSTEVVAIGFSFWRLLIIFMFDIYMMI